VPVHKGLFFSGKAERVGAGGGASRLRFALWWWV
jgi:hypothetical protein